MRHIILTRYNLPINFANADTAKVRQETGWLEKRKYLFDRYCLPSMRAQTNKNFQWFVGFAPGTPEEYCEYFRDVGTPIYATSMADFQGQVVSTYPHEEDTTIVSRLDNDDALAKGFVDTLQKLTSAIFDASETMEIPHVVNFRHGWEIDDNTGALYSRDYPNSSFFSFLVGPHTPDKIFEVEGGHHAHVHKHFPVTNINLRDPMWMITVHGDNIGNQIVGKPIDSQPGELERLFGLQHM